MQHPQGEFPELVELCAAVAGLVPVHRRPLEQRAGELDRRGRRHAREEPAGPPGREQHTQVALRGKALDREHQRLDDYLHRIGDLGEMPREAVEVAAASRAGHRGQQVVGAGEVPVHGLPGHAQLVGYVAQARLAGPVAVDAAHRRADDALASLGFAAWGVTAPAVTDWPGPLAQCKGATIARNLEPGPDDRP